MFCQRGVRLFSSYFVCVGGGGGAGGGEVRFSTSPSLKKTDPPSY